MRHDDLLARNLRNRRDKPGGHLKGIGRILMIVRVRSDIASPVDIVQIDIAARMPEALEQLLALELRRRLVDVRAMKENQFLHVFNAIGGVFGKRDIGRPTLALARQVT